MFKRYAAFLLAVSTLSLLASASSALALSPWWHLTSGSRPTYLHAGLAHDAVQDMTVNGTPGESVILSLLDNKHGETHTAEFPIGAEVSVVQASLEELFEPGAVHVAGGAGAMLGLEPYVVTFVGPLTDQNVETIGHETANVTISKVAAGGPDGELNVTAENLGDADAEGGGEQVRFADVLPPGLKAVSIVATQPQVEADFLERRALSCSLESLSCTVNDALPPYETVEMRIGVVVQPGASSGELNEARISGGEAASASIARPITISEAPVPFGVEDYELVNEEEGGAPATQAGAHPFQQTTTIDLNQGPDANATIYSHEKPFGPVEKADVRPAGGIAKDTNFKWPAGLIGNPTVFPQCTNVQFFSTGLGITNACPPQSAVGVATVVLDEPGAPHVVTLTEPLFNLVPRVGEPARFGFYVVLANTPVFIDTSVRTGGDYGVTVSGLNITQISGLLSAEVTVWGVPGDPRHDKQRGWGCLLVASGLHVPEFGECNPTSELHPPPFLSLPTSCASAPQTSVEVDSWTQIGDFQSFPGQAMPTLEGCNRLPFSAEIKTTPDGQQASTPTGLTADVHVPQEASLNSAGLADSNVKDVKVVLPEGVTLNPAAADGLEACSESQIGFTGSQEFEAGTRTLTFTEKLPEPLEQGVNFCPDASKIGTAKITTPLLPHPLEGAIYLAAPAPNGEAGQNPFNTLAAIYVVAKDPVSGALVKLPGSVSLNQETGRIEANFEDTPQLAFEDAELHFFGGDRAPLATPARCGTYTSEATFTPWSGTPPIKSTSSFQITSGPNGGPCANPVPFAPTLATGSTNISAGAYSPLTTTVSREDGNQNLQTVQLHYPPGLSGVLANVPLCPEAQANAGTCGQQSVIGHTVVSVGLGGDPFSVTGGQVFLTEKYAGAPFGLSIVNPANAGPFHLGNVVVRAKVEVDPHTAALTVTTDANGPYKIPHILDGIPLQIKHVNVTIDRPGFTFNPTNCDPQTITGTIGSDEGASTPVSTAFQVTNCTALKFAPSISFSTSGKTSKQDGADLITKVTYPSAPQGTYANVSYVKVELPKALPSRLTTLQKACLASVFEANPAACPSESKIGYATVHTPLLPVPLTGPAIFVSHGGEAFPSLTMVLQGYGVTIDLVGTTFISKAGVTSTTFKTVPDTPFSTFELVLPQGPYSALTANTNLCKQNLVIPNEFLSQSGGAPLKQDAVVNVTGCKPAITVASHNVKGKTATLRVRVPAAGKLLAAGKGLSTASKTAIGATTLTVKLTLTNGEAATLAKHKGRKLRAKINLTFSQKKGGKLKASTTVIVG